MEDTRLVQDPVAEIVEVLAEWLEAGRREDLPPIKAPVGGGPIDLGDGFSIEQEPGIGGECLLWCPGSIYGPDRLFITKGVYERLRALALGEEAHRRVIAA